MQYYPLIVEERNGGCQAEPQLYRILFEPSTGKSSLK